MTDAWYCTWCGESHVPDHTPNPDAPQLGAFTDLDPRYAQAVCPHLPKSKPQVLLRDPLQAHATALAHGYLGQVKRRNDKAEAERAAKRAKAEAEAKERERRLDAWEQRQV